MSPLLACKAFLCPWLHKLFCTSLFICVYKCQFVSYLSFILPGFVILINFIGETVYIFSKYIVKEFFVAITLNMMSKNDCECKLELVVRSYYT